MTNSAETGLVSHTITIPESSMNYTRWWSTRTPQRATCSLAFYPDYQWGAQLHIFRPWNASSSPEIDVVHPSET